MGNYTFRTDEFKFNEMDLEISTKYHDYWFVEIDKIIERRVRYGFLLYTNEGIFFFGARGVFSFEDYNRIKYTGTGEGFSMFFNLPYLNYEDVYQAPNWVKDTIWYQIFPSTFASGNENKPIDELTYKTSHVKLDYVGDLLGIINKLDYLKDLGVTGIYFTPIFEASSVHKYDTRDYTKIDKSFGSNKDFRELVKEAHKRNIKVMLDGVFNHCGFDHPFFQDVIEKGVNSKYKDYFYIKDYPVINFPYKDGQLKKLTFEQTRNLNYRTFGFTAQMPKLNTGNIELQKYIIEVCKTWIRDYDIDGWRLDVSNEVSHSFWRQFRKEMRSVKDDIYIIGENWDNSYPWIQGDQFDAVMNFEIMYRIWAFLGSNKYIDNLVDLKGFISSLEEYFVMYPKTVYPNMFNFLDNHDTPRIINIMNENPDLTRLAFVLLMMMPGSPSIYYGTEQLIEGSNPGEGRKNMDWSNLDSKMYRFLKDLIAQRKNHPSMSTLNFDWLIVDNDNRSFKLIKKSETESTILYMNASPNDVIIDDVMLEPFSYRLVFNN
jgi:glycosidase